MRDVLEIINSLDNYSVPILDDVDQSINKINTTPTDYVGIHSELPLGFVGLEEGIRRTYEKIKRSYGQK